MDPDEFAHQLASDPARADDPTAWFEQLYGAAARGEATVPWDRDGAPHPLLLEWAEGRGTEARGRAVVVGAGYGSDAQLVSSLGYDTLAFDVSPAAMEGARQRHPDTSIDFVAADLLDPPPGWRGRFDLVVENMTVQALPVDFRATATAAVGSLVAPGGTLVVTAFGTEAPSEPQDGPPWPLTRTEVEAFAVDGLQVSSIQERHLEPSPENLRWLAVFTRP